MDKRELHNQIDNAERAIYSETRQLFDLSEAFRTTGNTIVAEQLDSIGQKLCNQREVLECIATTLCTELMVEWKAKQEE